MFKCQSIVKKVPSVNEGQYCTDDRPTSPNKLNSLLINDSQQPLPSSPHSHNLSPLTNLLIQPSLHTSPQVHAIRMPARLLLPAQPLPQQPQILPIQLAIVDLDLNPIAEPLNRARQTEAREEQELDVDDEDLLVGVSAYERGGAAVESEAVQVALGGGEGVGLVGPGERLPLGVVGVEELFQR
jgi:hypothetical protein